MFDFPDVYSVRQHWDHPTVPDVRQAVHSALADSRLRDRVAPGARVAVGVGSRGIADIGNIALAAVTWLKEHGYQPFVVAAMGSHGGATADGQRELLASYGVTESVMGVPIATDMATAVIGTNSWGEPVHWDKNALAADAVIPIARIKPHTDFHGQYESGIVKMLAIGLGKRDGAATHHQYGVRGLRDMIPESAKVIVAKTPFVLGLAVLENAMDHVAKIVAMHKEELFDVEPRLLDEARGLLATLPFDELDLLVVGELGKNYSGTGMDVNVLGRETVEGERDTLKPKITRICVLDLSEESHGNAVGAGMADLTTQRLIAKKDEHVTNVNYLTSCFLMRAKVPIAMENDRECIAMGIKSCWQPKRDKLKMVVIPNTLELGQLWVTAALAQEARTSNRLQVGREARALPFDDVGYLRQEELFPHCTRSRRGH